MGLTSRATAVVLAAVLAGCGVQAVDDPDLGPYTVEVLAVWEGTEAARFEVVLAGFEARTAAQVVYTSAGGEDIATVLDERLAAGDPPDLAIVPLPSLIERYAAAGAIQPIDDIVGDELSRRYAPVWRDLATVDGELYGVWFKAAHKSLIWYDIAAFERLGLVPPADLDGLLTVAGALSDAGVTPFALGAGDPWTITDWFENLYLRVAGPVAYDELADRRRPWTDRTVAETLDLLARVLADDLVSGGLSGARSATFPDSVVDVFGEQPTAAMLAGGDFVAGFISGSTDSVVGIDADVFLFPEADSSTRVVMGGGDAVVALRRSPAADALVRYLAGPEAGEAWSALGGFLSPNEDVSLESYPDERTRTIARSLLEAGDGFRFDLSDLQPVEFGGTRGTGMFDILEDFLADPSDVGRTARRLELAAEATAGR